MPANNESGLVEDLAKANALLKAIVEHYQEKDIRIHRLDAPGHNHQTKLHWDSTGERCEWCMCWQDVLHHVEASG